MTTINYTLKKKSTDLFIKYNSIERSYINEKTDNFKKVLKQYFGNKISNILIFGSYKRDTILPRKYDEKSDIDVLIIFNQSKKELTPETYRNQLKEFANKKYSRTPVVKDHPSIVLELSKIKFDLVPCRIHEGIWSNYYQIPSKYGNWMDTYPKEFAKTLTDANSKYNSIVKPIIRLIKCWNAKNNYPYSSFQLEQIIADMNFSNDNLQSGFFYAIEQLPVRNLSLRAQQKVQTLINNKDRLIKHLENGQQDNAVNVLSKILY